MADKTIQLYSPKQVAGKLAVCTKTVLNLIDKGQLSPVYRINPRVIRIPRQAVDSYLQGYVPSSALPAPEFRNAQRKKN